MAKKCKFSILDKSADSADFDDPQIKKSVFRLFSRFSKILDVWNVNSAKNRIFRPQVAIFGYFENFHLRVFRRNFDGPRNFCLENIFEKNLYSFSNSPINI